jgi:hypothetical protein
MKILAILLIITTITAKDYCEIEEYEYDWRIEEMVYKEEV